MQSYCMLSLVEIDPVEWLQQQTLDKFWSGKLNLAFSSDEFNLKAFHLKMTMCIAWHCSIHKPPIIQQWFPWYIFLNLHWILFLTHILQIYDFLQKLPDIIFLKMWKSTNICTRTPFFFWQTIVNGQYLINTVAGTMQFN